MEIIIRSSVREDLANKIPSLIGTALGWMQRKYPTTRFNDVRVIVSSNFRGSSYFRNANPTEKHNKPTLCISARSTILLYHMVSLGMKKKRGGVFGGCEVQIVTAIIHELTHHHQYEKGLPTGELLTTANELEYLNECHPSIYKKFMK